MNMSYQSLGLRTAQPALLAPLLATTACLGLAIAEGVVYQGLLLVAYEQGHPAAFTLSRWWDRCWKAQLTFTTAPFVINALFGGFASWSCNSGSHERYLALAGTAFALAHALAFEIKLRPIANSLGWAYYKKDPTEKEKKENDQNVIYWQEQWMRLHIFRSLATWVPAWLCFLVLNLY